MQKFTKRRNEKRILSGLDMIFLRDEKTRHVDFNSHRLPR